MTSLLAISAAVSGCLASQPPADLVFLRGSIFGADGADALAVEKGRIVRIGTESAIRNYVGNDTAIIDLDGRLLVPGFADAHMHLYAGSLSLDWPLISEATSYDDLVEILRVHARSLPPGAWLRGVGWRHHVIDPARRRPTASVLDAAFPDRPVVLLSQDAEVWKNSRALDAKEPHELGPEERLEVLRRGIRYVHRFGITAVETSGLTEPEPRALYSELQRRGALDLHVHFSTSSAHEADVASALDRSARGLAPRRIDGLVRLSENDLERVAALRPLVRIHPFKISPDWTPVRDRRGREFPLRSLRRAGARLAFGSDWPLASIDPLAGIAAAATRQDFDGNPENGWLPEEKLSVGEALFAYTGRLVRVGGLADLAVLSRDLFKAPDELISTVKVDMTVFGGRIVYVSESFRPELGSSVGARLQ